MPRKYSFEHLQLRGKAVKRACMFIATDMQEMHLYRTSEPMAEFSPVPGPWISPLMPAQLTSRPIPVTIEDRIIEQ